MIKSMTGYGKASAILPKGTLSFEIRTLNGKNADVSLKYSILPKDKELVAIQIISESLHRGNIDVFMSWEPSEGDTKQTLNEQLALSYLEQLRELAYKAGCKENVLESAQSSSLLLSTVLRMPDVLAVQQKSELVGEEDWPEIERALRECLEHVNEYREKEGAILYKDVTGRVQQILDYYREVEIYEAQRLDAVKERILKAAQEMGVKLDKERFEQEMIFYLEKLDINEEKVRLRQHCKYFMETIDNEAYPGKKLGFIIQEMGREINTTGSKANHAQIQQLVVKIKDELEKIREQSMNIL